MLAIERVEARKLLVGEMIDSSLSSTSNDAMDLNQDGVTASNDALLIVNALLASGAPIDLSNAPDPLGYLDVNDDNVVSAEDSEAVFDALNALAEGNTVEESENCENDDGMHAECQVSPPVDQVPPPPPDWVPLPGPQVCDLTAGEGEDCAAGPRLYTAQLEVVNGNAAEENQQKGRLAVRIYPTPQENVTVGIELDPVAPQYIGRAGRVATADDATFPASVTFTPGVNRIEFDVVPTDDELIELNEWFDLRVVTQPYDPNSPGPLVTNGGLGAVLIKDDEWRWAGKERSIIDESDEKFIKKDFVFNLDLLTGSFTVDAKKANSGPLEGPDTLRIEAKGYFNDEGFFGSTVYSNTATLDYKFKCNSQNGVIAPVEGFNGVGRASDIPLEVIVAAGDPSYIAWDDNTHYVDVNTSGSAGVAGSFTVSATGANGLELGFSNEYNWSDKVGPFTGTGRLTCVKGEPT